NADYSAGLKNCALKDIITSHAFFGYLAATYSLRQISIAGLSPDAEPSSKEIGVIVKFAKENKVKYIFFESLVNPKLSETIATEIEAKTLVLNPLEGLTRAETNAGKNYFTEMRDNLNNLKVALECE
ncbi:MAG: zinc ABC transporter substrate-binding protein, partial [Patescibacteria group bacterium]